MAEWSNAAVLKTVVPRGTGGSNPSLSAKKPSFLKGGFFLPEREGFERSVGQGSNCFAIMSRLAIEALWERTNPSLSAV
jgi:hypothetical protein